LSDEQSESTWYHGSDQELTTLRTGSSVTENRDLARAFSHQPTLLSRGESEIHHNGTKTGFLYIVDAHLEPSELVRHPHPSNAEGWEWLTTREIKVRLLEETIPLDGERLSDEDVAEIRMKQQELGVESFSSDESVLSKKTNS
jgi:hypothetical protein